MLTNKNFFASIAGTEGSTASSLNFLQYDTTTNGVTYNTSYTSTETANVTSVNASTIGATAMTSETMTLGKLGGPWTSRTSAADNWWYGVTYGNGLFVAVSVSGSGNQVMTSPDGITWTSRTNPSNGEWRSVTYGNGLFVAVVGGVGNPPVMTSPDGITWTSRTAPANNNWWGVIYGNGLFVAVGRVGAPTQVMTSPDGITWTLRSTPTPDNIQWTGVTYGNGLFVAVALTGYPNQVMTSPDGITWTLRTSGVGTYWWSVTYGNGLFVAVTADGSGNGVMTSPDGITWTLRNTPTPGWISVTYGKGLFVAVAFMGYGYPYQAMSSPDGIVWTPWTTPTNNEWRSVTYGNGVFVAVSATGTGNRVMTWDGDVGGTITCGQVVSPIIQGPTGYNLSLEAGGTGYSLTSSTVVNSTTARGASVVVTSAGLLQRSTSSIRYKTDVEDVQSSYANNVWSMRPVWYRSTCASDRRDWSYYGLIAEEVAQLDPRLCFWNTSGQVESVMYDRILPLLLKAQKEKNASLHSEITKLKETVEGLEEWKAQQTQSSSSSS